MLSHQPGLPRFVRLMPAAWASPVNACVIRIAFDRVGIQMAVGFVCDFNGGKGRSAFECDAFKTGALGFNNHRGTSW